MKNVQYLSMSDQMRDMILWGTQNGYRIVIFVNTDTELSGPLQNLRDTGIISIIGVAMAR